MALKVFCVVEALVAERTHCDTAGEIFILLENKKQVYQKLIIFFAKRWRKKKYPKLELAAGLMFMLVFAAAFFMVYIFPFLVRLIYKD